MRRADVAEKRRMQRSKDGIKSFSRTGVVLVHVSPSPKVSISTKVSGDLRRARDRRPLDEGALGRRGRAALVEDRGEPRRRRVSSPSPGPGGEPRPARARLTIQSFVSPSAGKKHREEDVAGVCPDASRRGRRRLGEVGPPEAKSDTASVGRAIGSRKICGDSSEEDSWLRGTCKREEHTRRFASLALSVH
ncbi:hypothetical protein NL676_020130 [Syzygium grande]|nr:hypothetical protein NL676_020130 [Syzygium grande]